MREITRRTGLSRNTVRKDLALVLLHDEQLVVRAVEEALGVERPSKQHVLNCLSRLNDVPGAQPLTPPPPLRLVIEPLANSARYAITR